MEASGPQEERNASWLFEEAEDDDVGGNFDLGAPEQREELDAGATPIYARQYREMRKQNELLKDYSKRLEMELHRLQLKYPNEILDLSAVDPTTDFEVSPPWLGSHTYMAPLLTAYDARIKELENTVDDCTSKCEKLLVEYNELEEENKKLAKSLKSEQEQHIKALENSINIGNTGGEVHEVSHELHEQLQVLLKENALLTEQVTLLESEGRKMSNELEEKTKELETVSSNFQSAATTLKRLQESARVLRVDKEYCEQMIKEKSKELGELNSECEQLRVELEKREEQIGTLDTELMDQKRHVDELNERTIAENEFLEHQSMLVTARSKELKNELEHKEKQLDALRDAQRKLTLEHSKTRQDCEGMLKVMSGLEKQIVELAVREKQASDRAQDAENTKEQAILERDQAITRGQQVQNDAERLKQQLADREELAASDRAELVREQEWKFQKMRDAHDSEVKNLLERCATLVQDLDRISHERQEAESSLNALTASVEQEKERMVRSITEITDKLALKDRILQEREEEAAKAKQDATMLQHKLDIERQELSSTAESQSQTIALRNRQLETLRDEVQLLSSEAKEKSQQVLSLRQELQKVTRERDIEIDTTRKVRDKTLEALRQELESSRTELEQQRALIIKLRKDAENRKDNVSAEFQLHKNHIKSVLDDQQQKINQLKQRNSELALNLETQKQLTQNCMSEKRWAQVKVGQLNTALQQSALQLKDAKLQVAQLLEKEEEHLAALKEVRIEKSRLLLQQQRQGKSENEFKI